jgi:hypothetical protein
MPLCNESIRIFEFSDAVVSCLLLQMDPLTRSPGGRDGVREIDSGKERRRQSRSVSFKLEPLRP